MTTAPCTMHWDDGTPAQPNPRPEFPRDALSLPPGRHLILRHPAWDLDRYLVFDLRYQARQHTVLMLRFFAPGEDEARAFVQFSFLPGLRIRFCFPLVHLDGETIFLARHPGMLKGTCFAHRTLASEIDRAELYLLPSTGPQELLMQAPALASEPGDLGVTSPPLVDALGQWVAWDWPGRTPDAETMVARLRHEAQQPPVQPPGRSRYGGSCDHRFPATGFFRTQHDGRRWWLVDPEGHGFFSAGVDCLRHEDGAALVPGTEPLFTTRPHLNPHAPRLPTMRFAQANLERAFGDQWYEHWSALSARRLRAWGFNTVANWSDLDLARHQQVPYVVPLQGFPTTARHLFRDLPDVFDPAYQQAAQVYAQGTTPYHGDPLCIGYFMANEPKWGFGTFNLASEMLEAFPGSHSRRALVDFLHQRYGDEAAWQQTWQRPDLRFSSLINDLHHRLAGSHPRIAADLDDFTGELVERFVAVPAQALTAADPDHLNLGLRLAWIASDHQYRIGHHVDVFSINCYDMEPNLAVADQILQRCNVPVMIGEFHFGALDRGLLGTGLRAVASQADRGHAYRRYVEAAAAHPALVGTHYFQWQDQPALGRFDGECWNIGLVDICQQPYPELVAAATATHQRLYDIMTGQLEPVSAAAVEVPKIGL